MFECPTRRGDVLVCDDEEASLGEAKGVENIALRRITVEHRFTRKMCLADARGVEIQRHVGKLLLFQEMPDALPDASVAANDYVVRQGTRNLGRDARQVRILLPWRPRCEETGDAMVVADEQRRSDDGEKNGGQHDLPDTRVHSPGRQRD